jgi:K+/H+ antiporter YhaU regulatory subunit KhtT
MHKESKEGDRRLGEINYYHQEGVYIIKVEQPKDFQN